MVIGYWCLGFGIWVLGIGPNPQSPIPNPQSPIPSEYYNNYFIYQYSKFNILFNIFLINLMYLFYLLLFYLFIITIIISSDFIFSLCYNGPSSFSFCHRVNIISSSSSSLSFISTFISISTRGLIYFQSSS